MLIILKNQALLMFTIQPFRPRLFDSLKNYRSTDFFSDFMAGITVALVALPLAMAFAIASGLKPEAGIFTAIVAGFIISACGGSKIQIGGPAGAFIVVVYSIVERYGLDGLLISTLISGMLLFAMGLFRLGTVVRFVPVSIVIGFTNGIAVLIGLSQIKDFLGLQIEHMPSEFFARMYSIFIHLPTIDTQTVIMGCVCFLIVFFWPRITGRLPGKIRHIGLLPGTIIALVLATLVTWYFHLDIETIGSRFGGLPRALPSLTVPTLDFATVQMLFPAIITITMLGAIESLLCARVADSMINDRHNPNQELMAQGLANVAAPLLGGYCATGTIARTVTNIRSGARSPVSGIIHALALLLIILVAAPLAEYIPLTALAAILLNVAWNMGEWHEFARLRHFSKSYRTIVLATFLLTVIIDLTVAMEVGLILACLFFIMRVSSLTRVEPVPEMEGTNSPHLGKTIEAYRIFGSLFFGAAMKLEGLMDTSRPVPKVLILDLGNMLNIDTTGLEALETLHDFLRNNDSHLLLCNAQNQPLSLFKSSGMTRMLGEDHIFRNLNAAMEQAEKIVLNL
jgi:SulP family sulfate permease